MSNLQSFASRLQVVYGAAPEPTVGMETFDRGYEEGREEGLQVALEEARQERAERQREFATFLDDFASECRSRQDAWLVGQEPAVARLAVAIAAKIVGREVETNPDLIHGWVSKAMAEVVQASELKIRFNAPTAPEVSSAEHTIEIVRDPSIPLGCAIETPAGLIDARLDSMLAEALTALREAA